MAEAITIVLDTRAQTAGIQATVQGLGMLKTRITDINQGFSKINGWLSGIGITLSAGAFAKLAKDAVDAADSMSKAAQMAGISVQSFAGLAAAASASNVSIDALIEASKNLSKWMERTGQSGQSLLKVLLEQADAVSAMADGEAKITYVRDVFGRSGERLIPLLNQGSAAIRKQAEEARQFGAVIGPEFAKKSEEFNDNIGRMHNVVKGFFNQFADEALTTLIPLQEGLINWAKSNAETIKTVATDMAASVALIASALGPLMKFTYNYSPVAAASRWLGQATSNMHLPGWTPPKPEEEKHEDDTVKVDADAKRNADLKLEILKEKAALSDLDSQIVTAQQGTDTFEREQKLNALYKQRVQILGELKQSLSAEDLAPGAFTAGGEIASEESLSRLREVNSLLNEISVTEKKVLDNPELDTFGERMTRNLRQMAQEFRNTGAAIADVLTRGIKGAIRGVADGIWDVIDGTRTWGDIFQQVGRRIISDLIEIAIQELFLDALKHSIALSWKAFVSFLRGEDVVEHNATEAAKTPALAANATLASIESYGVAVVIGLALIAGVLASMGAFETGGVVEGGKQAIVVNERGREAVLNAHATALLGENTIDRLNAGIIAGSGLETRVAGAFTPPSDSQSQRGMVAAPVQNNKSQNVHLMLVDSRNQQAARDFMASSMGRAMIIDIVKNNKTEAGIL